jgi:plasmid maintenance system antidote protein VapI
MGSKHFRSPFHPGQMLLEEFRQPIGFKQGGFADRSHERSSQLSG